MARTGRAFRSHPVATRAPREAPPDPGILVAPVTRRGARARAAELRRRRWRTLLLTRAPREAPPDPGILVAPRGRRGDRARKREQYRFRLRVFLGRLRLPLVTTPTTPITCLTVTDAAVTELTVTDAVVTGLELSDAAVTGLDAELSSC